MDTSIGMAIPLDKANVRAWDDQGVVIMVVCNEELRGASKGRE